MFKQIPLLKPVYYARENNILKEFYIPVMKESIIYNRASAYFSAKALCDCAEGIEYVAINKGQIRIILSEDIEEDDFKKIKLGYDLKDKLNLGLISKLELIEKTDDNIRIYSNLAYLIAEGLVDIKIAFMRKGTFHYKFGVYVDAEGNEITSCGSDNLTDAAVNRNGESFDITCSWLCSQFDYGKIANNKEKFENLWNNKDAEAVVLDVNNIVLKGIIKYNKGKLIMDNAFLKENCFILDYENERLIGINKLEQSLEYKFIVFSKMYLRRFIESSVGNKIIFKENLTYVDFEKIITLFKNNLPIVSLYTTTELDEYIKVKQMYLHDRKKLGVDIKIKSDLCKNELEKYRLILSKNMTRQLREQQLWDSFYMYKMKKCSNFSVPGSGKTSSVLGVFSYLQNFGNIDKIVVICPKNAFESWKNEFNMCFENKQSLKCFDVQGNLSSQQKHYLLNYEYSQYNLFLFNYESLNAYKKEIKNLVKNRTLLVYDEVHKAKAINGERATNSIEIAKDANYVITMTGTPIPNSYLDIYNNLHILYPNEYDSFFGFKEQFLKNPNEYEREQINYKIKPFYCRTSKEQLDVPVANKDIFYLENATNTENRAAEILYSKYKKNKFSLIVRLLQLESCPEMLLEKLDFNDFKEILDITINPEELDYSDASKELKDIVQNIGTTIKTKRCINLVQELYNANKSVIIWTLFRKSISNLRTLLDDIGICSKEITGGTSMEDRKRILDKFLNKEFNVLITNPQTLAESISLHSVCHDAIYYEYSYNLVHLLQSKDRIHRLGLPKNQYTQYYYLQTLFKINDIDYSLDTMIFERLKLKEEIMLKAVDDGKLERVFTEQEDIDAIFKKLDL